MPLASDLVVERRFLIELDISEEISSSCVLSLHCTASKSISHKIHFVIVIVSVSVMLLLTGLCLVCCTWLALGLVRLANQLKDRQTVG